MLDLELIIFDLDGTLIDSRRDIARCVNLVLGDMELSAIPDDVIYSHVGHGVRDLMKGAIEAAHGEAVESAFAQALELFDQHYTENLLIETELFAGMAEFLEQHRQTSMAVITNKPQKYTDLIIAGLGLESTFGPVLGREACANPKPHAEPVLAVLNEFPVAKEKAIIIGDTEVDVAAGKNAGIKTCGVLYGFGDPEVVKDSSPDFIAADVAQLRVLFS
jgi:2-phosphoglycolate phosphatase